MSHFSCIKTSIKSLKILQKTLEDLKFTYSIKKSYLKNGNGELEYVDIIAQKENNDILGFLWNGEEYTFIADLELWQDKIPVQNFIEKILQQYALNSIIKESHNAGFQEIQKETLQDGSIKLIVQRWI
uniref:Uncharacterized protein ycf35 n=1 Tax=Gracilariopsis longissima TaxID=172976 RepID=A0A345U9A4_9FLOR|nr:hypothetical protein [Gracilariopsis longissima]AXI97040.1 hypothetical protein [Gracilariopsis longissima]UAD88956.1 hypothetical protein [Gracilariopsis longissima]